VREQVRRFATSQTQLQEAETGKPGEGLAHAAHSRLAGAKSNCAASWNSPGCFGIVTHRAGNSRGAEDGRSPSRSDSACSPGGSERSWSMQKSPSKLSTSRVSTTDDEVRRERLKDQRLRLVRGTTSER